jgi:D-serine deaminase-like pyridoxal phosphate-dependent protein
MDWSRITRPTLLLDEQRCRANIARMCNRASAARVALRPHLKTAQSRIVAAWLREHGVRAITTSSLGMARYFAEDGWDDITLAFPFNPREIDALNAFPEHSRVQLLVEHEDVVRWLATQLRRPVDLWLKIDTGLGRTGIEWHDDDAIAACVRAARASHNPRLRGLLTHAGMTYAASSPDDIIRMFSLSLDRIAGAAARHTDGERLLVSVGDTPGCTWAQSFRGADELRPGNFVFHDCMQLQLGVCAVEHIAVALAAPIVALHARRGEVVVHGGAIHLSKDALTRGDGAPMYGLVCLPEERGWSAPVEGAYVRGMSQEHGILRLPEQVLRSLHPGDPLLILPVHSCLTAQAMRGYRTLDGNPVDHYAAVAEI